MWKILLIGCSLACTAVAQSQIDYANLREDVRGLSQRVTELGLRIEQLERENSELRQRVSASGQNYVTLAQLNEAVEDMNRTLRSAVAASKGETLQQVATQMEKLAKQTNAALDSLARAQAARPAVQTSFSDEYAREGISYTVEKGESLAAIAKKTGARMQDIVNANKLSDPSKIAAGQILFIPNPPSSAK